MLKLYDYLEQVIENAHEEESSMERKLTFFANDVMEALNIIDHKEAETSMNRAFQACISAHIPLMKNFKRVYRFNGEVIIADWQISPLACYLLIINSDPGDIQVANAQLFFLFKNVQR